MDRGGPCEAASTSCGTVPRDATVTLTSTDAEVSIRLDGGVAVTEQSPVPSKHVGGSSAVIDTSPESTICESLAM